MNLKSLSSGLLALALLSGAAAADGKGERIISLGGSVTEIAVALGAESRLIGRDTTSNYPPSIEALPDVGYIRALSPEGVFSLDPDLIIAEGDAGPPEAVEVLKKAGIPFITMPKVPTPDGIALKIRAVGEAIGETEKAEALATEVAAGLKAAEDRAAGVAEKKRVMFILAIQGGRVMAGGEGTEAEGIIRLAGGENAVTGIQGYKQLTDEAVLEARPDVILMMDREGDLAILNADILAHPALADSPAAKAEAIMRMDGMMLLGFGPRTPQAAKDLFDALYPGGA